MLSKVNGVPKVDELRPITLLNCDYKLLTKMIVARMLATTEKSKNVRRLVFQCIIVQSLALELGGWPNSQASQTCSERLLRKKSQILKMS